MAALMSEFLGRTVIFRQLSVADVESVLTQPSNMAAKRNSDKGKRAPPSHSDRKATIGSTRTARIAGR
jgi:hypothetical protein